MRQDMKWDLSLRFIRLGGLALLHGVPNMGVRPRELFLETSPLSINFVHVFFSTIVQKSFSRKLQMYVNPFLLFISILVLTSTKLR